MIRLAVAPAILGVALLFGAAPAAAQSVHVGLLSSDARPAPGETIEIQVRLMESSPGWNAYELELAFDPGHLEPVPLDPLADQEGDLMTAACSQRWHRFEAMPGRLTVSHAVLCPGARVVGPGELYRFRFRVLRETRSTVGLRAVRFVDGGVDLSASVDDDLEIGAPAPASPSLRAWPNPFRSSTRIELRADRDGAARVEVLSVRGSLVRSLGPVSLTAGVPLGLAWDGLDARGRPAPAGVYLVRAQGSVSSLSRIVRVP